MFAQRYFPGRFFAKRYFPTSGAGVVAAVAAFVNRRKSASLKRLGRIS